MAAANSLDASWRPISSLALVASVLTLVAYGSISFVMQTWDADAQLQDLKDTYRTALANEARSKAESEPASSMPDSGLLTPDSGAALSSIQQTLQKLVVLPATLESLHSLDPVQWQGLDVVRASFRIRNLPPDQVLDLIHRIEGNRPAIVFDTIRIAIQTRPPPIGVDPSRAATESVSADLSGIVQAYATRPPQNPSAGDGQRQP